MICDKRSGAAWLALAMALMANPALAQRVAENAVTSAEDAFGSNVGMESTGIYTENDTRGFSPTKAGNVRIDGIYFDPVFVLSGRLRASTAIRVGFASEDYPFHAPTGIVDHRFRPFPEETGASLGLTRTGYGGSIGELDLRLRSGDGRFALTGGLAYADNRFNDGTANKSWGWVVRPIARLGQTEIAPFAAVGRFVRNRTHTLVTVGSGTGLPAFPQRRLDLAQPWAVGGLHNENYGVTVKSPITDSLSLRAGLFYALSDRRGNFAEIYSLLDASGRAAHRVIADPDQDVHSTSGEVQLAWRHAAGAWQHRVIVGVRGRSRLTETGGSDVISSVATPIYGMIDPIAERPFVFRPVNQGRVRQMSFMLGYTGQLEGVGTINLGLQKARYRATNLAGATGVVTRSQDNPWLYNATLGFDLSAELSAYLGSETGLEDSGTAPEIATNRNEQLPSTRSTQYEAGLRWKHGGAQLVLSAFQITKPNFAFDAGQAFVRQGEVRHRGIETSFSGHFGDRLHVVAGAVLMQPRVLGAAGGRPAGTPSVFARLDANYRTDLLGGLTPTLALVYTGSRAVTLRSSANPATPQLMAPGSAVVDLGLRQQLKIGSVPASVRLVVYNVLDDQSWKVVAANTLYPDERRRVSLSLAADF